jgi:hypothetical protein
MGEKYRVLALLILGQPYTGPVFSLFEGSVFGAMYLI